MDEFQELLLKIMAVRKLRETASQSLASAKDAFKEETTPLTTSLSYLKDREDELEELYRSTGRPLVEEGDFKYPTRKSTFLEIHDLSELINFCLSQFNQGLIIDIAKEREIVQILAREGREDLLLVEPTIIEKAIKTSIIEMNKGVAEVIETKNISIPKKTIDKHIEAINPMIFFEEEKNLFLKETEPSREEEGLE